MEAGRLDSEGDTVANVIQKALTPQERIRSLLAEPRRAALCILGIYLAGSAAVLATSRGNVLLVDVTRVDSRCGRVDASRPAVRRRLVVGDLLPLVVPPLLYAEIPALIGAVGSVYHDATIQALELRCFGASGVAGVCCRDAEPGAERATSRRVFGVLPGDLRPAAAAVPASAERVCGDGVRAGGDVPDVLDHLRRRAGRGSAVFVGTGTQPHQTDRCSDSRTSSSQPVRPAVRRFRRRTSP